MLGIGEESGLQLSGEQTGNMPGPEWMQIHHPQETMVAGANGQRFDRAGLHAGFAACNWQWPTSAIANGGTCYYPRLVDKVLNQDGSPVLDEQGKSGSLSAASAIGFTSARSRRQTSNSFGKVFGKLLTKTAEPVAERV